MLNGSNIALALKQLWCSSSCVQWFCSGSPFGARRAWSGWYTWPLCTLRRWTNLSHNSGYQGQIALVFSTQPSAEGRVALCAPVKNTLIRVSSAPLMPSVLLYLCVCVFVFHARSLSFHPAHIWMGAKTAVCSSYCGELNPVLRHTLTAHSHTHTSTLFRHAPLL